MDATNITNATAPIIIESPRLISWLPDWVLFTFIGIICLIIYHYSPDDIKYNIKKFLKAYGFYIALFILWLYFRLRYGFVYEYPENWPGDMRRATFYAFFILTIYQLGKWLMYMERYYTRAFICNGVHGSCNRFQEVGDYVVFFIGTCGSSTEKIVLPWPIPKKLVVVPRIAVEYRGEEIVANSQVFHVDLIDLPEEVAHFIETDIFARLKKDDIYFGLWDEETRAKNPDYDELESNLTKANARINELVKMLKGKLTATKQFISDTLGMTDKIRGKSWQRRRREESLEE